MNEVVYHYCSVDTFLTLLKMQVCGFLILQNQTIIKSA